MKVKLTDVIEALDFSNQDTEYYYNMNTEEVLMIFDGMVNGDDDPEVIEEIKEGFEEYIPLPGQYEIDEYNMMEEFINIVPEGIAQSKLEYAIQGRGAFRRFKDTVYDLGLEQKRYKYRDEVYEKIAREWCDRNKIDIVE